MTVHRYLAYGLVCDGKVLVLAHSPAKKWHDGAYLLMACQAIAQSTSSISLAKKDHGKAKIMERVHLVV
jgi:hypothetical protein